MSLFHASLENSHHLTVCACVDAVITQLWIFRLQNPSTRFSWAIAVHKKHLWNTCDTERSDRYPFFNICRESLPLRKNFPNLVYQAIKQCHVRVEVLSEEFFMSKWPMLEVVAMVEVQKENCEMKIVPMFLDLSHKECHDEENITWSMSKWCEFSQNDNKINIKESEVALKVFEPINDISCIDHGLDEVKCHEEIVETICQWVPPNTMRDDSFVQVKLYLCKVK